MNICTSRNVTSKHLCLITSNSRAAYHSARIARSSSSDRTRGYRMVEQGRVHTLCVPVCRDEILLLFQFSTFSIQDGLGIPHIIAWLQVSHHGNHPQTREEASGRPIRVTCVTAALYSGVQESSRLPSCSSWMRALSVETIRG